MMLLNGPKCVGRFGNNARLIRMQAMSEKVVILKRAAVILEKLNPVYVCRKMAPPKRSGSGDKKVMIIAHVAQV